MRGTGRFFIFTGFLLTAYFFSSDEVAMSKTNAGEIDAILIENFNNSIIGQFPPGWGWLDGTNVKKISEASSSQVPYTIMEEKGNKYLHADDTGQAITIVSDKKWNIKKYPCLTWRWRVNQFPTGANEKMKGKGDSAAGIYITYYVNFFGIPKSIKYIWSNELGECDIFAKEGPGRATQIVVESGTNKKGVWIVESINIYDLYKKAFGEYPPDEIAGIAIRTDADGTQSRATADYDDIIAKKTCAGKCE